MEVQGCFVREDGYQQRTKKLFGLSFQSLNALFPDAKSGFRKRLECKLIFYLRMVLCSGLGWM